MGKLLGMFATAIDKVVPWYVGHRSTIAGAALILLNAYKGLVPVLGLPAVPSAADQIISDTLSGGGLAFLVAKAGR